MEFTNHIITVVGLLFAVSIVASGMSPRLGIPTLLIFLAVGMLAGEDGFGGIVYNDIQSAHLIGSLALAIILFDGGLHTNIGSFRSALRPALLLSTVGVLVTAGVTGLIAMWLLGLEPVEALLLGAVIGSTDAAAVFALLKHANLSLHPRVGQTLEIESGTNDPMAVFLTILMIEAIVQGRMPAGEVLAIFGLQMGLGLAGGVVGGYLLVRLINRVQVNEALYPLLALFGGILIFGLVSQVNGSGFLAAYAAGLVVGNGRLRSQNAILNMNDAFAWLAQIGMFLILGLLVSPSELISYAVPAMIIAAALILVARPLAVLLCLTPLRFGWREQTFISWVGLRGAVPIILAMFPLLAGIENARPIFNVAFFVVLLSLIIQGATVAPVARWLKLDVQRDGAYRRRMELDVPGQVNYEVVGYTLKDDNNVVGRTLVSLPLPGSVRIIGVMRRGVLAPNSVRLSLRPNDVVYLLSPIKYVERLDQIFLSRSSTTLADQLAGEFDVSGQASAADVFLLLGIGEEQVRPGDTIQQLFARDYEAPQEGVVLRVGNYEVVAQSVENNKVTSARVIRVGGSKKQLRPPGDA